ncbi:hypothetical protein QAD02_003275 [Eretmocerus hayati]|uniref:Uncharacterized protein n=1 Tax=Eretmocerus hayati TaxID=131215 RepID=A0ACC2NM93_9HYME|nr:hypothetical protein QAD02_003275 [Eretmocerus hayati]
MVKVYTYNGVHGWAKKCLENQFQLLICYWYPMNEIFAVHDVKRKLRNYRKTLRLNLLKRSTYYLQDYLQFPIPHLDSEVDGDEKEPSSTADGGSVLDEEEKAEKLKDIQNLHTELKGSHKGRSTKAAVVGDAHPKITPPPSKRYRENMENISTIEQNTIKIAAEAIQMMKSILENDEGEKKKDPYLPVIKQALLDVSQSHLLLTSMEDYYSNGYKIEIKKWEPNMGEIHCFSCKNKGPIKGNYAECSGCESKFHPSCAERANIDNEGIFSKCCPDSPKDDDPLYQEHRADDTVLNTSELDGNNENDISKGRESEINDLNNSQMLDIIRNIIKKDSNNTISRINENTNAKIDASSISIEKVSRRLFNVENELSELGNRVKILENTQFNEQTEITEAMINEVKERPFRERNVIIFGIPESSNAQALNNLLAQIFADAPLEMNEVQYTRIGKPADNKSRPVKLMLKTVEQARWVLKNQRDICPEYIRCSNDKTCLQQQQLHTVMNGLEERNKNGKNEFVIKYIKNVPTVIPKRNSSNNYNSSQLSQRASTSKALDDNLTNESRTRPSQQRNEHNVDQYTHQSKGMNTQNLRNEILNQQGNEVTNIPRYIQKTNNNRPSYKSNEQFSDVYAKQGKNNQMRRSFHNNNNQQNFLYQTSFRKG